jgi:Ca2+-binding EF-hand superfamily protein
MANLYDAMPSNQRLQFPRDRSQQLEYAFQLLDPNRKGYIEASDLQRLSKEMGEPISGMQAESMVEFSSGSGKVNLADFRKLMSPPEP